MTGPVVACVLVLIMLPMALFAWGLCVAAGRTERLDERMRAQAHGEDR